ncbi:MAG: orotate phosphoribosyltransferase [Flavobacteriales bacterium]|nr:orotate phosphoribosyltransferase [Flavobacteriales bacterium]
MIFRPETAAKVAEFLLQIKAVKLQPNDPFTWASGIKSPIYCDNRLTLSYPQIRTYIRQEMCELIQEKYSNPELIAGVATGGIAQGALVAQELGTPFAYVRASSKGHGLQNQVEGAVKSGQDVVVIEDLISTGMSGLDAVAALRDRGLNVKGMVAIFSYGFDSAYERFEKENCPLTVLCDYHHLLNEALQTNYINQEELSSLQKWRDDPKSWNV